jgi:hypothetical protein
MTAMLLPASFYGVGKTYNIKYKHFLVILKSESKTTYKEWLVFTENIWKTIVMNKE